MTFTFIDLFSGIGGFRIALEKFGGECLGYSEIDKKAVEVYQKNFNTTEEIAFGNIADIQATPFNVDVWTAGLPCQPWSVAGKRGKFQDKRGMLWFNFIQLLKIGKPKTFIVENVLGLTLPSNRENFNVLLSALAECSYHISWKILNTYDYGLAQYRERVFIVGIRADVGDRPFIFPVTDLQSKRPKLIDIFDDEDIDKNLITNPGLSANCAFTLSDVRGELSTVHSWDITPTTELEKHICLTIKKIRRSKSEGEKDGRPLSYERILEHIPELSISHLHSLIDKKILHLIGDKYDFVNSKNIVGIKGVYKIIFLHADYWPTLTASKTNQFIATANIDPVTKENFLETIYLPQRYTHLKIKHIQRLQGFPDTFIPHKSVTASKQHFGNAVAPPVVSAIAQKLITYF